MYKWWINNNISKLASIIDTQIYKNYKLWKTNYIAFDLLNNSSNYENFYTLEDKENFVIFLNDEIALLNEEKEIYKEIYLKLYANPVLKSIS